MSSLRLTLLLSLLAAAPLAPLAAQESDVVFGSFVSFLAPAGRTPLTGLSLTLSGTPGFGLRLNGRTALRNGDAASPGATTVMPPWGLDADAVFGLSGRPFGGAHRSVATVGFVGYGIAATDSGAVRTVARNWSYGIGTTIPLGRMVDLFADSRWRMTRFVLPTARPRPSRTKELRFGLALHVGAGA
ncbi:MAG: hypothetical protein ACHQRK_10795 [Gemmatimonadales bacterium]